jgi:hypothetical protein
MEDIMRPQASLIKQFTLLIAALVFSLPCNGQENLETKLIGKWSVCYKIDTIDIHCIKPFNFYIFERGGRCKHGEITILDQKIPVTGSWKYEKGSIEIVYDKHPNYSYPKEFLKDIIFIADDLFYYKVLDKVENPGHWVFYSFKRVKQ